MRIKMFLFDLDGLLIDSEKVYKKAWKHAFEKLNIDVSEDLLNSWSGKSTYDMSSDVVKIYGDIDIYNKAYEIRELFIIDELSKGNILSKKYSGEALIECKRKGYSTGLVTSSPRKRVIKILEYFGWDDKFDCIVTASDISELKPNPKPYLKALETLGISPENAVAFEDSITGYTAGVNAGIKTYLIPDTSFNTEICNKSNYNIANDLSKVIELIAEQF